MNYRPEDHLLSSRKLFPTEDLHERIMGKFLNCWRRLFMQAVEIKIYS